MTNQNSQASWLSSLLTFDIALLAYVVPLHIVQLHVVCIIVVTPLILWLYRLGLLYLYAGALTVINYDIACKVGHATDFSVYFVQDYS